MKLKLRILPAAVAGALAASMYGPAFAQTAAAVKPNDQKVEEIVVTGTGTRIKSPGVVSNSPITSIAIEEIQSSQPVAVEEFIKSLPSAVPAIGPGTNNGSGGGATIDLRNLGSNRTLVLLDGRRITPFNLTGSVDTNSIPIALLHRVDLITGGASAVYGADAISGVVNFVLRRDFKGLDVSHSYGVSSRNDAERRRTDITVGAGLGDGRGNVALSVGFTDTTPLLQRQRKIGEVSLGSVTGTIEGSSAAVPATFSIPGIGFQQLNTATGTLVPYYAPFNFNPLNLYVSPMDRTQITALGHFTVNSHVEAYSQLTYTRSDVVTQLAPSGSFFSTYFLPVGNPFIPNAVRQQLCGVAGIAPAACVQGNPTEVAMGIRRRFVELGPRLNDFLNKSLQTTVGLRGDIVAGWSYDAYWSQGKSDQTQIRGNWGSFSKLQQSLRSLNTTSCINPANGCVPINLFGAEGSITPAMLNFINLSTIQLQSVDQRVMSASVSGDLPAHVASPFAKTPVSLAFGAEERRVIAGNVSDSASQIQNEVLGAGAPLPDRKGTFTLKEFFGEAYVPLVKNAPLARSLVLELGYRTTDFTTSRTTNYSTHKVGLEWEPVQGLRFRGMEQQATRAPSINELFAPLVFGLSNLAVDPCQRTLINQAQANTPGTLSNLCRQTGVPLASIGSLASPAAGQINNQTGGNPTLGPEVAKTQTIGVVWQPTFAKGLGVTLDFYKIDIDKAVSSPSTTDILNDCYSAARNPGFTLNAACARGITRNPLDGTLNGGADTPGVATPLSNLGKFKTSGYDLTLAYRMPMKDVGFANLGRLDFSLQATQVKSFTFQPTPNSINRDCLGFYSVACGAPLPKRKFNQRTTWTVSDFVFGYNWRYQSEVEIEPLSNTPAFLPAFSKIEAYSYFDLSAVWNATKNIRLNLSVNNVTDKSPPNVGNTISNTGVNSGNTFPQSYDVVGRYYSVGVTYKF